MTFVIGLIILALFLLALHKFTDFNHGEKVNITVVVLSVIAMAVMFNEYSNVQNEKMMDATKRFKQNRTLNCEGVDVNASNYTLSVGTHTFIGRENTPLAGEMISASDCE